MASPLRTLRILYAAIVSSTVVVALLGFLLPPTGLTPPPLVAPLLGVVAVVDAVLSFVMPSFLLGKAVLASPPEVEVELDAAEAAGFRAASPARRVVRMTDEVVRRYAQPLQSSTIVGLALSEAISLFGLVLSRLGADWRACAPFFAAGTCLALLRVPSIAPLASALARATGAELVDATTATTATTQGDPR
jgi:hypothetical protein